MSDDCSIHILQVDDSGTIRLKPVPCRKYDCLPCQERRDEQTYRSHQADLCRLRYLHRNLHYANLILTAPPRGIETKEQIMVNYDRAWARLTRALLRGHHLIDGLNWFGSKELSSGLAPHGHILLVSHSRIRIRELGLWIKSHWGYNMDLRWADGPGLLEHNRAKTQKGLIFGHHDPESLTADQVRGIHRTIRRIEMEAEIELPPAPPAPVRWHNLGSFRPNDLGDLVCVGTTQLGRELHLSVGKLHRNWKPPPRDTIREWLAIRNQRDIDRNRHYFRLMVRPRIVSCLV